MQNEKGVLQVKAYERFQKWLEKSHFWIGLCERVTNEDLLCHLKNYFINETLTRIDRDIKIIQDYAQQNIASINTDLCEQQRLKNILDNHLALPLATLISFKHPPSSAVVGEIFAWSRTLEGQRQKLFEEALGIIDGCIEEVKPDLSSAEEHQHLLDLVNKMNILEDSLKPVFTLVQGTEIEKDSKHLLKEKIVWLAKEAHELSLDLRIPQVFLERLEKIQKMLKESLEKLD
jgi:hypothetical protein